MDQAQRGVTRAAARCFLLTLLAGCSGAAASDDPSGDGPALAHLPYARSVERFEPGEGAGFGAKSFPEVVLGPPQGGGRGEGSLDVLSLGLGGEIVLAFGSRAIVDGPGPDFVVFENPFYPNGDPSQVYAEPGEVAVSEDGTTFVAFPCEASAAALDGCAGKTPTETYDPLVVDPIDPQLTGGDAFDLEDVGLTHVLFVRIRDRSGTGAGDTAGFDLDSVGAIHAD